MGTSPPYPRAGFSFVLSSQVNSAQIPSSTRLQTPSVCKSITGVALKRVSANPYPSASTPSAGTNLNEPLASKLFNSTFAREKGTIPAAYHGSNLQATGTKSLPDMNWTTNGP